MPWQLHLFDFSQNILLVHEFSFHSLRSPSPGKLISFMVEDGGHVFAGEAYAEIEVRELLGQIPKRLVNFVWDS